MERQPELMCIANIYQSKINSFPDFVSCFAVVLGYGAVLGVVRRL